MTPVIVTFLKFRDPDLKPRSETILIQVGDHWIFRHSSDANKMNNRWELPYIIHHPGFFDRS